MQLKFNLNTRRQRVADPRSTQVDYELKLTQTAPRSAIMTDVSLLVVTAHAGDELE